MSSESVTIDVEGVRLRGTLFLPDAPGPHPIVVVQSGLGGPASSLHDWAPAFTDRGLACLMYDHRNTGTSDGQPRQEFDPWRQCRDLRHVITWLTLRPDLDRSAIMMWGISIGGANTLFTMALDKRVRAGVVLIPPVSGKSAKDLQPADTMLELEELVVLDREARFQGEPARTLRLHGVPAPGDPVMFADAEGLDFVEDLVADSPEYVNAITLSTLDALYEMEVTAYAERIDQPVLFVLASEDTVAPVEEAREMYARIPQPKELIEYDGQHYEILTKHIPEILERTADYLVRQIT